MKIYNFLDNACYKLSNTRFKFLYNVCYHLFNIVNTYLIK